MGSLADVFRVLNRMRVEQIFAEYAIGGATAVLFYAEPARTYDIDVFILGAEGGHDVLTDVSVIYRWAESLGFAITGEHVIVHGVPVQFLPADNALMESAIREARLHKYDDVDVEVPDNV